MKPARSREKRYMNIGFKYRKTIALS
jgi:hypothetical protein